MVWRTGTHVAGFQLHDPIHMYNTFIRTCFRNETDYVNIVILQYGSGLELCKQSSMSVSKKQIPTKSDCRGIPIFQVEVHTTTFMIFQNSTE